ncbi:hypothetical protein Bbelb_439750 [Branchiostoma belcheri]|nr:hypothetical protein Bbelb_439750 [Branchiostoma belcheri]
MIDSSHSSPPVRNASHLYRKTGSTSALRLELDCRQHYISVIGVAPFAYFAYRHLYHSVHPQADASELFVSNNSAVESELHPVKPVARSYKMPLGRTRRAFSIQASTPNSLSVNLLALRRK